MPQRAGVGSVSIAGQPGLECAADRDQGTIDCRYHILNGMTNTTERPAVHLLSQLATTFSPRNDRLFVAMLILAVAPLWIGGNLPMVDIPQHAAQIAALRELWAGNDLFVRAFEINWFTPYLLGYLLLYAVALLVPIMVATQIVVSIAVVSIPILTGSLLRAAQADERWKWLAIPASFSFAFYWGFLSFMVAVPVALLFLIRAIKFAREPSVRSGAMLAAFAIFLFFCHVIVLGFTSLVALGYVFGSSFKDPKRLALKMLPFTAPLPLIAGWLLITYENEPVAQKAPVVYGPVLDRLLMLLIQPAGWDSFSPVLCLLVTGSVVLLPFIAGSSWSHRPERWLPFALGLATFLSVPTFVLQAGYFYERLGIFLVPLWLMAWDAGATSRRRFDWLGSLVVVIWILSSTARFVTFARETESFRAILAQMEPGRTVAAMVVDRSSPLFAAPVYTHFPVWYQATRAGIVDFNFADFYSQPVRYRADAGARLGERLAWYPALFSWDYHGGAKYDYFLVRCPFDISPEIFKERRGDVQLLARIDSWWLYRNALRQQRAAAATATHDQAPVR